MPLIQLHWQNRKNLKETVFVAQFELVDRVLDKVDEVIQQRKDECPVGWQTLVCTENAPMFERAVKETL